MRHTILGGALAAIAALGGCAGGPVVETAAGDVEPAVPTTARVLPEGAALQVRLNERISAKTASVGEDFTATVTEPLYSSGGEVVVPAGATVYGEVTAIDDSDHIGDPAAVRLNFTRLAIDGRTYPFSAAVTSTNVKMERTTDRGEVLEKAGVGAAAGALLGAIIGENDLAKILGGAAIGAAAGTVIALGTGDVEPVLPAGTTMALRTTQTVALR